MPKAQISRVEGLEYNENPRLDKFVFVCGLHRSGTTLLERLITSRFEVASLRATVPENEGQHLQSVYSPAKSFGGLGRFAFSPEMAEELRGLDDHDSCRDRILASWKRYVVGSSTTLLEKSPPNLTKIWWLRQVFPGCRFIILARDPRAVSTATRKLTGASLPLLMMHWKVAYSQAMRDFSDEDCIIVRYEDMVADHEREQSRIGDFLGLQLSEAPGQLESRFDTIRDSNAGYIEAHQGASYGAGIWQRFGYDI